MYSDQLSIGYLLLIWTAKDIQVDYSNINCF